MGATLADKRHGAAPVSPPWHHRGTVRGTGVCGHVCGHGCTVTALSPCVCVQALRVQAQLCGSTAVCQHGAGVHGHSAAEAAPAPMQAHAHTEPFPACRDVGRQAPGRQHGPVPAGGRGRSVSLRGRCRAWAAAALYRPQPERPPGGSYAGAGAAASQAEQLLPGLGGNPCTPRNPVPVMGRARD